MGEHGEQGARPVGEAVGPEPAGQRVVAAVDLGSNSFHMAVARCQGQDVTVLDRVRERVQLAGGLTPERRLDEPTTTRALEALARFRQRLGALPDHAVRAVGTNTLRKLRDGGRFVAQAREALGRPIEIISGHEEGRLIYRGVSHDVTADAAGRRLVVDIGGGSTEVILGEGSEPSHIESLQMGCVSYSRRFFPTADKGARAKVKRGAFERALLAARLELKPIARRYRSLGWASCVGSSGTIRAVAGMAREAGWSPEGLRREGVERLVELLLEVRRPSELPFDLSSQRAAVLPGGLAVLLAVFDALQVDVLTPASGALREGILWDLLGREAGADVREGTVATMMARYGVDQDHAARVEATALAALDRVAGAWNLQGGEARRALSWAARLHEVGLSLAHSGYHRHGAYIVENSDMPGFSQGEQAIVASLVRFHRRKIRPEELRRSPRLDARQVLRLLVLLRLAVRLHRGRQPDALPPLDLIAEGDRVELTLPSPWLEAHPLTRADLEAEAARFAPVGVEIVISS